MSPEPPGSRIYVLWRHQYEDVEILGVFTSPEKFQAHVAERFPRTAIGSRWRRGNGEWRMSTPDWEYVATPLTVDEGRAPQASLDT